MLAAAMPVWQSILQGKSVLFVFGSLVPVELSWEHTWPCWPLSTGCLKVTGYGGGSIKKVSA